MRTRLESALMTLTTAALAGVCLALAAPVADPADTHWRMVESPPAALILECDTHWRC
ncbi:hypothetical protein KBX06_24145 [Micromonospora sp. C31]|uniref:hypothetical protein n=1 Tax=Micromonospora sp. C31 TaxID=2824876 RepID=UPI001B363DB1|nr:hypothetical protein [Micromonospora sp. C31]MBQ1076224.1 hypothetical protein [Micromonospora sp. C31]